MTGHCSTTLHASDVVRSDTMALPCVGSPKQGCRRVRWALECELTLQTNESEEMGMKTPLGTCVNRRWGKEGLWPPRLCYSSSSFGHCLLSQACSHPSVTSGTVSSQHTWCLIFIGFSILIPEFSPQCSSRNPSQLNPQIFIFLKKKNQVYICIYFVVWELFFPPLRFLGLQHTGCLGRYSGFPSFHNNTIVFSMKPQRMLPPKMQMVPTALQMWKSWRAASVHSLW